MNAHAGTDEEQGLTLQVGPALTGCALRRRHKADLVGHLPRKTALTSDDRDLVAIW